MIHVILTGHSKGLGAGLTEQFLNEGVHVHGISRTNPAEWDNYQSNNGSKISFYPCDLAKAETIEGVMEKVFSTIRSDDNLRELHLVNNAGVIFPIGNIETLDPSEIDLHFRINLLAPVLITREFINRSRGLEIEKRIMNISSGAAVSPYQGWSTYCTGKAGLDMFTRCGALEQQKEEYPVKMIAVAPGIIDTDMQTVIRSTTDEQFVNRQKFVELKETGQLVAPAVAGKKLMELLMSKDFENGSITDIRHLY